MRTARFNSSAPLAIASCAVLLAFGTACSSGKNASGDSRKPTAIQRDQISEINRWTVEAPAQASVDAGVIRQRTLYDYHFVAGTSRLTQLGSRDLSILARHYRESDWILSVRQGDVDDALYTARVTSVTTFLEPLGVDATEVTIVDALPGGDGLHSRDARRIRKDSLKSANALHGPDSDSDTIRPVQDSTLEGD